MAAGDAISVLSHGLLVTASGGIYTDPGVANVRAAATYTFNSSPRTGTLVLPAEADVEAGVGYGAGGTEFTGTLGASGGGGSGLDIEQSVWAHLVANAGVEAILDDRIYPAAAPGDCASPYAVYLEAGERFYRTLAGDTIGLRIWDMDLAVFATSYDGAKAARKAIYDALIGLKQQAIADGSVLVGGVFHERSDAGVLVPIHATETGEFRAGLRLTVHATPE
jgi:hypothetical protein